MRSRTAAYFLQTIENLEKEVAFLKALVQQAISEEEADEGRGHILVEARCLGVEDEILADATAADEVEVDERKPAADRKPAANRKPAVQKLTRAEQLKEGRQKAKEWAEAQKREKTERLARSKRP
jgi:hypothetical protein